MRVRLLAALVLFFGSYLPLSLILLAQDFDYKSLKEHICSDPFHFRTSCRLPFTDANFSIPIFVVCLVCFFVSLFVLRTLPTKRGLKLEEAKYIPAELMNYTLPYVVSFMSISYQDTGKFIGLLIFLLWMFWITYRSGQIMFNPVLIAFGWRLFEVKYRHAGDNQEYTGKILANGPMVPNRRYRYSSIQDVIVVKNDGALDDNAAAK